MNAVRPASRADQVAFALGLSSLALLPAWDAAGALPPHARTWVAMAWPLAGVLLLAALLVWVLSGRGHRAVRAAGWVFVVVLFGWLLVDAAAATIEILRGSIPVVAGRHYPWVRDLLRGALLFTLLLVAAWGWRHGLRSLARAGMQAAALAAPLPLIVLAGWLWPGAGAAPTAEVFRPARQVMVVLIFDELDAQMIERAGATLPSFRELLADAFSATQMYPPANYTSESLPGMLTGEDYEEASYTRREVYVRSAGAPGPRSIAASPSLLSADSDGLRKSVIGWHLPYCSVFPRLHSCWDDSEFRSPGRSVWLPTWLLGNSMIVKKLSDQRIKFSKGDDLLAYSRRFFQTFDKYRLQRIGEIFAAQRRELLSVIDAGQSELVFAHLACPHPPSQRAGEATDIMTAYIGNLPACDKLLGEVMKRMRKQSNPWQLVVTSDHWFRGRDWIESGQPNGVPTKRRTVPFFVLIDGVDGARYSTASISNNRVLKQLVDRALHGPVDYAQVREMVDAEGDHPTVLRPF